MENVKVINLGVGTGTYQFGYAQECFGIMCVASYGSYGVSDILKGSTVRGCEITSPAVCSGIGYTSLPLISLITLGTISKDRAVTYGDTIENNYLHGFIIDNRTYFAHCQGVAICNGDGSKIINNVFNNIYGHTIYSDSWPMKNMLIANNQMLNVKMGPAFYGSKVNHSNYNNIEIRDNYIETVGNHFSYNADNAFPYSQIGIYLLGEAPQFTGFRVHHNYIKANNFFYKGKQYFPQGIMFQIGPSTGAKNMMFYDNIFEMQSGYNKCYDVSLDRRNIFWTNNINTTEGYVPLYIYETVYDSRIGILR